LYGGGGLFEGEGKVAEGFGECLCGCCVGFFGTFQEELGGVFGGEEV